MLEGFFIARAMAAVSALFEGTEEEVPAAVVAAVGVVEVVAAANVAVAEAVAAVAGAVAAAVLGAVAAVGFEQTSV